MSIGFLREIIVSIDKWVLTSAANGSTMCDKPDGSIFRSSYEEPSLLHLDMCKVLLDICRAPQSQAVQLSFALTSPTWRLAVLATHLRRCRCLQVIQTSSLSLRGHLSCS